VNDKLELDIVAVDVIDICAMPGWLAGIGDLEACIRHALLQPVETGHFKGEMREARRMACQVTRGTFTIVRQRDVGVVVTEVQPLARLARPCSLAAAPDAPVRESGFQEVECGRHVGDNEIGMFEADHGFAPFMKDFPLFNMACF